MSNTKMTKKEMFEALLNLSEVQANAELVDGINHEISLLNARASAVRKPSQADIVKAEAKKSASQTILGEMEIGKEYLIKEMIETLPSCAGYSVSGLTSVMAILIGCGDVNREERKRKSWYTRIA